MDRPPTCPTRGALLVLLALALGAGSASGAVIREVNVFVDEDFLLSNGDESNQQDRIDAFTSDDLDRDLFASVQTSGGEPRLFARAARRLDLRRSRAPDRWQPDPEPRPVDVLPASGADIGAVFDGAQTVEIPFPFQSVEFGVLDPNDTLLLEYTFSVSAADAGVPVRAPDRIVSGRGLMEAATSARSGLASSRPRGVKPRGA